MINALIRIYLLVIKIKVGKNISFKGFPIIIKTGRSLIEIGENTIIKSSFLSNLVGLYSRTIIITRTPYSKIIIGRNVGISGATIYARNSIFIGDNTLIGGNVKILDNDFHPIAVVNRNTNEENSIGSKPIVIGSNCFIGVNTLILKGTELGDGCVVGAGAVVSGKFPPNCVIVGNPAKIIRTIDQ